jgi:RNA polymerase sigma-70 factor (ECF subfamily)
LVDTVTSLAMAAQGGDRAALHGFVRATQADVWRLCAHLADPASADDLTQETYARAMASLAKFREASARTWLLAIARRVVVDDIRSRQVRRRRDEAMAAPHDVPTRPLSSGPDGSVSLAAAVGRLDDDRRIAFVLTQLLGLSYAEAAEVCRCPVGTIRSRIARARADLIRALADDAAGTHGG